MQECSKFLLFFVLLRALFLFLLSGSTEKALLVEHVRDFVFFLFDFFFFFSFCYFLLVWCFAVFFWRNGDDRHFSSS